MFPKLVEYMMIIVLLAACSAPPANQLPPPAVTPTPKPVPTETPQPPTEAATPTENAPSQLSKADFFNNIEQIEKPKLRTLWKRFEIAFPGAEIFMNPRGDGADVVIYNPTANFLAAGESNVCPNGSTMIHIITAAGSDFLSPPNKTKDQIIDIPNLIGNEEIAELCRIQDTLIDIVRGKVIPASQLGTYVSDQSPSDVIYITGALEERDKLIASVEKDVFTKYQGYKSDQHPAKPFIRTGFGTANADSSGLNVQFSRTVQTSDGTFLVANLDNSTDWQDYYDQIQTTTGIMIGSGLFRVMSHILEKRGVFLFTAPAQNEYFAHIFDNYLPLHPTWLTETILALRNKGQTDQQIVRQIQPTVNFYVPELIEMHSDSFTSE